MACLPGANYDAWSLRSKRHARTLARVRISATMDPIVSALGGVIWTAILIVFVLSTVIACTEVRFRSQARFPVWLTSGLLLYVFALGVGNIVATVELSFLVDLSEMGSWSALMYAAGGLGAFHAVFNNLNVTYLDHGIIAIQDWTRKAREIAVQKAYEGKAEAAAELRSKMEEALPNIQEEQLKTHLAQCCGGADFVNKIVTEARESGGDPKRYMALELADRAPKRARSILKSLTRDG
jgi:hypothetical protein